MKRVAIVGLGTMGSAIQNNLLQEGFEVIGIDRHSNNLADVATTDTVIIAVKPQSFAQLAPTLQPYIQQQVVISIMAGVTTSTITAALGTTQVVRTMPNLAVAKRQSITAWYTQCENIQPNAIAAILELWGTSLKLEHEDQFHAFTAIAGSGPAYFFELASLLQQAAVTRGFSATQAQQMSLQTLRGAASVLDTNDAAKDWVQRVASKGGTTEAALRELAAHGLAAAIETAIEAACARSQRLGVE